MVWLAQYRRPGAFGRQPIGSRQRGLRNIRGGGGEVAARAGEMENRLSRCASEPK